MTSLAWRSRRFGILVMSEWPSSHCGLNCWTFIWDTDILGVGVVRSGTTGTWEWDPGEHLLSGMPQVPRAWTLPVQGLPWGWHGESHVAVGE